MEEIAFLKFHLLKALINKPYKDITMNESEIMTLLVQDPDIQEKLEEANKSGNT